ncbi:glycosyl hydrolase family 1 [Photobacterium leiognathi subsp. mandapamensis]|nr:glycosyl hydrolase family 1 [Photobacterium leiognathi subsp. mandapamensis]
MLKKIAHIQVIPKLSGVQQISLDILSNLPDECFDKFIICSSCDENSKKFKEEFLKANVEIIEVDSLKRNIGFSDLKAFIELYRLFKMYKFDIVHTNSTKPGIIARIAAKLAGINNIIHTVHGIAFHKHVKLHKRLFYFLIEYISCFAGDINILVNNNYKKYYPLLNNKVIYNGVNFNNLTYCENKTKNKALKVAFMARLDEQKNPLMFIEAVNLLINDNVDLNNVEFLIAGDGELKYDCIKLIEKLKLNDKIKLVGWVDDKSKFLSNIDIICQPSKWEAFGLIFVEAAFFQIPSIGSDVEGIPEVIKHNETGLIFESNNVVDLKNKLFELINNHELRISLGKNAKKYCLENFNMDKMTQEYNKIYK